MTSYIAGEYDVAVIGAGHAGIEAALASARLGAKTAIFTINMDAVGNCPCNPSIGGTAKGHLVREIDALGGEMGKTADEALLQMRMLNLGKGPAVHSLRAQIDRRKYQDIMKHKLELTENLELRQAEIVSLVKNENEIWELSSRTHAIYLAKKLIIATGTYLGGRIFIGDVSYESGPDGMFAATKLSQKLKELGVPLRRFKTGTPARVNRRSIDYSELEAQHGDEEIIPFSFENDYIGENRVDCHITYTNEKTHDIIRNNIHLSPLYSGMIKGVGPRYCPSIEDKVMRFADKTSHQLFIEPCGLDTEEMYIQGLSSSLPEFVQRDIIKSIKGLENAQIMRVAYAIEYDCVDPLALYPTLEFKAISGLYGAGQFNGSSGYEEAAAQGLVAGINAAKKVMGNEPFILDRASSYIGTLIDDLTTKGTNEPYRMMTSRSEYRLILRQDNADLRLTPKGHEIGLISDERYERFLQKKQAIEDETERLCHVNVSPKNEQLQQMLRDVGTAELKSGCSVYDLLSRPQVSYADTACADPDRPTLDRAVVNQVEISIKYKGYIEKQLSAARDFARLENKLLPEDIDYSKIIGLRIEARQKLADIRPVSLGQASRISGVSPADISVLMIYLEQEKKRND